MGNIGPEDFGMPEDNQPDRSPPGGVSPFRRLLALLGPERRDILIVVVILAGIMVLTEVGLNVAPLIAGVGLVGLAVGFGAQSVRGARRRDDVRCR